MPPSEKQLRKIRSSLFETKYSWKKRTFHVLIKAVIFTCYQQRHVLTSDLTQLERAALPESPDEDPDIQTRLVEAIATLNPSAVEMLVLRYEHNYREAEIAKLLGKSRGVVSVTLFRTRARLRKLLRSTWSDDETK
jgi:RNA polymerase sigma factor (sigma-70 family)